MTPLSEVVNMAGNDVTIGARHTMLLANCPSPINDKCFFGVKKWPIGSFLEEFHL